MPVHKRLLWPVLLLALAYPAIITAEAVPAETIPTRTWQIGVTAGFNSIASGDELVKKNSGAEIGLQTTLPYTLWKEDANLFTLRGQFTSFSNGIDATAANGDAVKLVNASHSQARLDFRQIFIHWGIHWSAGLGVQIPITTNILTPRGEFRFADARSYYPDSTAELAKIDKSFAGYVRLGIDQKFLADALLLGVALEIGLVESPKTQQRAVLNFYAGARIW